MASDQIDMLSQRVEDILDRVKRIEDKMFAEEFSPKHLWDKLSHFVDISTNNSRRLTKLEHLVDKMIGACSLLVILMPLVTAILNPTIRKLLYLE